MDEVDEMDDVDECSRLVLLSSETLNLCVMGNVKRGRLTYAGI